eukprot:TRINITY_DN91907_c0_g1_i1.p1 TRINITY_DN91907_c0_g1~~TRINITY_DN91907_c0_g1_i1.p1  ORF type:complete len:318 (-),score=67.47 TRINITY_DN91907_c0_g1_i1:8-961(-)
MSNAPASVFFRCPADELANEMRDMDIDYPYPKRQRIDTEARPWWEAPRVEDSSAIWGLCDALSLYASGAGSCSCSTGLPPSSPGSPSAAETGSSLKEAALLVSPVQVAAASAAAPRAAASEPLLRALTQLANAAAAGAGVRRQLVAECQVHAPLLRLMQGPWGRQPLVAERCCRLLHWLCARAPENREVLAAHYSLCGVRSLSFVDALLDAAEGHHQCRDVMAHVLRALAALLPCPRVREDLQTRTQPRLLSCLTLALQEALDVAAVRAVCRWLPGLSGQVRQAKSKLRKMASSGGAHVAAEPLLFDEDEDVQMTDA